MMYKDLPVYAFVTQAEFYQWLGAHHDTETAFWLRYYKKHSGRATIKHPEAVEVALCWGWIDGLLNKYDEDSYVVKFTPRRPKSIWSQVNVTKVSQLIEAGLMQPAGLKHVEAAQADGRWSAAYAGQSTMEMPAEFLELVTASPIAAAAYAKLTKAQRYSIAFAITTAKTPAGKQAAIRKHLSKLETS